MYVVYNNIIRVSHYLCYNVNKRVHPNNVHTQYTYNNKFEFFFFRPQRDLISKRTWQLELHGRTTRSITPTMRRSGTLSTGEYP